MEVNRRHRRVKMDRLDVHKLLTMPRRHIGGEQKVWRVVRVPSAEVEDRRQRHRELLTAKRDRTWVAHRIQGLLAGDGMRIALRGDVFGQLARLPQWHGSLLPPALRRRLARA
jgi:hypothetical protein